MISTLANTYIPLKRNTALVIDDELAIRNVLTILLESAGYNVIECENGQRGIEAAAAAVPEVILLDLGLPDMDGREVVATIRKWSQVPIIVCSVRNSDDEVVKLLNAGVNDYIFKPFNPDILLARMHANLRKTTPQEADNSELSNGAIRMNLARHKVYLNGEKKTFTRKEFELLHYFLTHCGKMLTHKQILKDVWGEAHTEDLQYLRVYISQLRDKIETDVNAPRYINTEPGVGYRMEIIASPAPQLLRRQA